MTRVQKIVVYVLVLSAGLYGCAKNPSGSGSGSSERNSSSEARLHRAEEDLKTAAAARDQYRQKLLAAEERQTQLQKQLDQERAAAATERDALKDEVKLHLTERDTVQSQYDGFRKGLRDLLAQAEGTLTPPVPNIPTIPAPPTTPPTAASPITPAVIGTQSVPSNPTGSTLSN
jgi:hypothetical protein